MRCGLDCTSLGQSAATFEVLTDVTSCSLVEMDSVTTGTDFQLQTCCSSYLKN